MEKTPRLYRIIVLLVAGLMSMTNAPMTWAASHREAPLIALDPTADITDVCAFRSWEDPNKAVFIMNVIPSQVPASEPNFFNFDDDVLYAFHFDINGDGKADDLSVEFRFLTEIRPPFDDLPVAYAGVDPMPGLPPAITALDGANSAGLGLRQRYSVRAVDAKGQQMFHLSTDSGGKPLIAVPANVGSRTMPNYPSLAAQGIFDLGGGIRVFAGQRKETFYIDLGSAFDTLNFRRNPPLLSDAEDADDSTNPFGLNDFQELNINTIAIEIHIATLPSVLGMYASTSRQRVEVRQKDGSSKTIGSFVQVARLANPLVNELIIGTGSKDFWNATDPATESQFLDFYQNPRLAAVLNLAFGIPIPLTPRHDLVAVLLKYAGQSPADCTPDNPCAELLRLDLTVPPTPAADQKRLTVLAHDAAGNPTPDPAGWPNGRRPNDDVTDIAIRVVAGLLAGDAWRSPRSVETSEVIFPPGAGGLPTLKLGISFRATLDAAAAATAYELRYRDTNFPGRAGWREIIASARPGMTLLGSTVPEHDRSQELADYPTDLLNSPPQDVEASIIFAPQALVPEVIAVGTPPTSLPTTRKSQGRTPPLTLPQQKRDHIPSDEAQGLVQPVGLETNRQMTPRSSFTELVSAPQLDFGIVLMALAVAVGLGAFHALEPGHGKTVVAAYLIGSRGTAWHALTLGLIVTVTHTAEVYMLGAVTLLASRYVVPERLHPWLGVTSGLIIAGLGFVLLLRRYAGANQAPSHVSHHTLGPAEEHSHVHGRHAHPSQSHPQHMPSAVSRHELLALGLTGGIVPCPAALVVLLSALSLNRVGFGLLLIVAFSLGLAAVLIAIGILMVYAHRLMTKFQGDGVLMTCWLPLTSATVMTLFGVAIAVQALITASILQIRL